MTSEKYSYCTTKDIKRITGVKPKNYGFTKKEPNSTEKLEEILQDWINLASSTINDYCNTNFKEDTPETIRLACIMIVSNLIAFGQIRRDTPIIKKNDWNVDFVKIELLNDELKAMLNPFKVEPIDEKNSMDFFAITGE